VNEFADASIAQRLPTIQRWRGGWLPESEVCGRTQRRSVALASRGIGIDDVVTALQRGNTNYRSALYGLHRNLTVQATDS